MQHRTPPPYAIACAGLSAFGPLLAALAVAGPRRQLGQVFGRWRTNPAWILLALAGAPLVHTIATALFVAIGGRPTQWFYPPNTPETVAALVVFSLGEEFGWRGFAHPRLVSRFGAVGGCLILGALWGVWHLAYSVPPDTGRIDLFGFGMLMAPAPAVRDPRRLGVRAREPQHGGRDRVPRRRAPRQLPRAPRTDLRLQIMYLLVLAALAAVAARSLSRAKR